MKNSVRLSVELIEDKMQRIFESRLQVREKLSKLEDELDRLNRSYAKLEKEKQKLLNSQKNAKSIPTAKPSMAETDLF